MRYRDEEDTASISIDVPLSDGQVSLRVALGKNLSDEDREFALSMVDPLVERWKQALGVKAESAVRVLRPSPQGEHA